MTTLIAQEAHLNDQALLSLSPVKWSTRIGVSAVVEGFDVSPGSAGHLRAGSSASLRIIDNGNENIFDDLTILRNAPGAQPPIKRVLVADLRWTWPYKHILRRYNMRRRTGIGKRVSWKQGKLSEPARLVRPMFAFAPYSLNPPNVAGARMWTAIEILEDILSALDVRKFRIEKDVRRLKSLPVENLVLDDSGDQALSRVLSFLPGADVVVDPDGTVRVFSVASGAEIGIVGTGDIGSNGSAGPEIVNGGGIEYIGLLAERPSAVDVLFTIESELRFDFLGDDEAGNTVVQGPRREVENVIQIPDYTLTLHESDQAALGTETVAQGTWLTVGQALRAWGTGTGLLASIMSHQARAYEVIRRAFIPRMGLWAALGIAGEIAPDAEKINWAARLSALQAHFRQSFRIQREYRDSILSLAPYLVATIDPTSGQRAPALVFADHAIRNSQKAIFLTSKGRTSPVYATNVDGYPGDANGIPRVISETDKPAPAVVQIVDQDQGIIRVDYQPDPFGMGDIVFPSKLENVPSENRRKSNKSAPIAFNAVSQRGNIPQLSKEQRAAIVLTAVPAAPNRTEQLYRIRVRPSDVSDILPSNFGHSVEGLGPVQEVRVGAGVETARIMWEESSADKINKIFGVGGYLRDARRELSGLCINDAPQQSIGNTAASLTAIAKAVAASIYTTHFARVHGSMSTRMNADLTLCGSIQEIAHTLKSDGAATSMIGLPSSVKPLDLFSFMPSSTRQVLMKLVQPQ